MEKDLRKEDIIEYATLVTIINNLYRKNELNEKEYSYAKILLKQEFGIFYN